MNIEDRIEVMAALGRKILVLLAEPEIDSLFSKVSDANQWFRPESVRHSLEAIAINFLAKDKLETWLSRYKLEEPENHKIVALVMAGNIPLVGWHDLMCILLTGHKAMVKLSSKDEVLPKFMIKLLGEISSGLAANIELTERLQNFDAVIATGSANTSRYFDYYFGKYPHIIRKNRSSVAILTGTESEEDFLKLGKDIFDYYGMGCRSVSKLLVPEGYNLVPFLDAIQPFKTVLGFLKYEHNYDFNKSILLLNKTPHLDAGFMLIREDEAFASPMSTVYYSYYKDEQDAANMLENQEGNIQCVVGDTTKSVFARIPFGKAQEPELWDYADGVDTIAFLMGL